jgi:putative FmdB family regulatory protein
MPLYEFKCRECFHAFEEVQAINDPPLFFCPRCRGEVDRKFFDWEDKLKDFRQYDARIAEAPIVPYFFLSYLVILLVMGLLGGLIYRGAFGFMGVILFCLGISGVSLVGCLPVVGPFLYYFWLGRLVERFFVYQFGLQLTLMTGMIFWLGFFMSLILTMFTSLYLVYRFNTPILWCFMGPSPQLKLKFLLLSRLLNYEMTPAWFSPSSYWTGFMAKWFEIREIPAIRLMGRNYYGREIPVEPIKQLEKRRQSLAKKT